MVLETHTGRSRVCRPDGLANISSIEVSYPALSLEAARNIDEIRRSRPGKPSPDVNRVTAHKTGADFDITIAVDCLEQCWDLVYSNRSTSATHAEFDSQCAPLLHSTLKLSMRVAGDADFWRWLTFMSGGSGAGIVDWRFGSGKRSDESGFARPVYYGLGSMKKGMFAKLWICANLMYLEGAGNPYDGIEYQDVDLWDSHVIDVDYGSVPTMARSFVNVVRDLKLPRGSPNDPDKPAGYRDLAKEIRRRQATTAFELFDDAEAGRWIRDLWNERASWHST